jgi:glycosyltransferase involved in cell wall biosynthesis
MMKSLGHDIIFYGAEGSQVDCDEFVQVISDAEQKEVYGGYNFREKMFQWDQNDKAFQIFNRNAAREIKVRKQAKDFILVQGTWHYGATLGNEDIMAVDYGVGYKGVFTKYRVFESYAWMHHVYGLLKQDDGSWYDAVIPNYFDITQFEMRPKKDYYLYFGRLIPRKGLQVVSDIAKHLKIKVLCVGQGKLKDPSAGWDNCNIENEYLEHIPAVGVEDRKRIMAEAKACFLPTYYLEPFGGVAVEAQLSGTPVITSDWGAFPETVDHGHTGFR